jgi:hypothetical protein
VVTPEVVHSSMFVALTMRAERVQNPDLAVTVTEGNQVLAKNADARVLAVGFGALLGHQDGQS